VKVPRLVQVGGKLAIICVIAAVVLGLVNAVTAPVIVENRARALALGLNAVAAGSGQPGATVGEATMIPELESVTAAYPVIGSDGQSIGWVLQIVGEGYGGDMNMLAGYFPSGELFAAKLMENQETPGLGKKAESPEYMEKFLNQGGATRIPVSKTDLEGNEADSITGATITFIGIARALSDGSEVARQLIAEGGEQ